MPARGKKPATVVDEAESFEDVHETEFEPEPEAGPSGSTLTPVTLPTLETLNAITEQFLCQFAEILAQTTQASRLMPISRATTREPEPFNGSDSRKLHQFLLLCELNFRDCPEAFSEDASKVNYVLSYLK